MDGAESGSRSGSSPGPGRGRDAVSGTGAGPGSGSDTASDSGSDTGELSDRRLGADGVSGERSGGFEAALGDSGGGRLPGGGTAWPTGPGDVRERLEGTGYLVDDGLAVACFLALKLRRPIFCEGDAGVGKTSLASALASALDAPLIRLQCYEGIDASQALYDWDFPRQLLHLRAAEAAGVTDADRLEGELYGRRFLVARPLLRALETQPCVLLVDEIDRADDEFEAFLLELLSEYTVTVPELGTLRAESPPVVVLTSNRTREVHDALKRRCLYHWFDHPGFARELAIVRGRLPGVTARLAEQVTGLVQALRAEDLVKPPGVAETIDWAEALDALGATEVDAELAVATLGSVLKYREDLERARGLDLAALLSVRGA
ncbi:AAA family ATPase [Streptomyces phaeochromogenes]